MPGPARSSLWLSTRGGQCGPHRRPRHPNTACLMRRILSMPAPEAGAPMVPPHATREGAGRRRRVPKIPLIIGIGVLAVLVVASALAWRAEAKTNKVDLAASPQPVTVFAARAQPFRVVHLYVGALRPWIEAHVGPQFIS